MSPARVDRMRSAMTVAVVTGAVIAMFACGSSNTSSATSPSPSPTPTPKAKLIEKADACTLVTASDASTAAGVTVTSLGPTGASGGCFYGSSDGKATVLVFAQTFSDASSATAVSPEQIVAGLSTAYGIADAKVVSGIGDKAVEYSLTGGATGYLIFVVKSNVVMMIAVSPATSASVVEQLATTAVGRLS